MSQFSTSMACALLQPALRSFLIFDAPFTGLQQAARQMVEMAAQTGQQLRPVVIGFTAADDDLWGESLLPNSYGKIEMRAQVFSPPHRSEETLLIIIPDLSTLSLAAARASIMLMGADVAHLERHGQQGTWSPRYYWLASCRQEVVGSVSPHLLDRFALRLSWRSTEYLSLSHQERVTALQKNMQEPPDILPQLASAIAQHIKQVIQHPPLVEITVEACELILNYQEGEIFHQRRELALARCALALAQLANESHLQVSYVEQAAELMGLQKQNMREDTNTSPNIEDMAPSAAAKEEKRAPVPTPQIQTPSTTQPDPVKKDIEIQMQEPGEQRTIDFVMSATDPYPEDTQPVLREAGSLQVPPRHFVGMRSDRGSIIGVEPATTLRDLALVSTLMRAFLFQAFRPKQCEAHIVLDWSDLRKYRRAAEPERLLLLLLDYTSLGLTQRQRALVPYLSRAYVERAGITIIKVGAASDGAKSDLRAEHVSARNILVPAISEAIDAPGGSATPLAHGMELALQVIRHTLQHGRSTVQHITFVIVSDGRGNVPLKASHSNTITPQVTREGFEDTLEQAREIGQMKYVSSVVLSPKLRYYQELPLHLAEALKAQLLTIDEEGEQA